MWKLIRRSASELESKSCICSRVTFLTLMWHNWADGQSHDLYNILTFRIAVTVKSWTISIFSASRSIMASTSLGSLIVVWLLKNPRQMMPSSWMVNWSISLYIFHSASIMFTLGWWQREAFKKNINWTNCDFVNLEKRKDSTCQLEESVNEW